MIKEFPVKMDALLQGRHDQVPRPAAGGAEARSATAGRARRRPADGAGGLRRGNAARGGPSRLGGAGRHCAGAESHRRARRQRRGHR